MDRGHLARIVDAAELRPEDTVLEVGPGLGALTEPLAETGARVIAVEIDADMRALLQDGAGSRPNVEIVAADILETAPEDLLGAAAEDEARWTPSGVLPGYKVVANLPYYITSAVLRHLLTSRPRPERLVVMLQKEVADRIRAEPGAMSLLALSVQLYARPRRVSVVPAGAFHPPPKVDSAVLRLDCHEEPVVDVPSDELFFRVARAGFSQRRKQIKNPLSSGLDLPREQVLAALEEAGVPPTERAERLSLEDWAALTRALADRGLEPVAEPGEG